MGELGLRMLGHIAFDPLPFTVVTAHEAAMGTNWNDALQRLQFGQDLARFNFCCVFAEPRLVRTLFAPDGGVADASGD